MMRSTDGERLATRFGERVATLTKGSRLVAITTLTLAWCAMWRDISVANVLAGAAIAVAIALTVARVPSTGLEIRSFLTLTRLVLWDLVTSTYSVAKEVLTPTDHTDEVVLAVPVPECSRNHLTMLTVAITLTPGTAVIDAELDPPVLHLHLLHRGRSTQTFHHTQRLATLARQAFPVRNSEADPIRIGDRDGEGEGE